MDNSKLREWGASDKAISIANKTEEWLEKINQIARDKGMGSTVYEMRAVLYKPEHFVPYICYYVTHDCIDSYGQN